MQNLRQERQQRGMTLAELAGRAGIQVGRLSDFERGRRVPGEAVLARWREALGLPAQDGPTRENLAERGDYVRMGGDPDEVHWEPAEINWVAAVRGYHREYQGTDEYLRVPDWFRERIRVDSALEGLAWTQLAEKPGRLLLASPVVAGFLTLPLMRSREACLGAARKACFSLRNGPVRLTLWPQVSVLTSAGLKRPDALLLVQKSRKKCWAFLEIDGAAVHGEAPPPHERDARLKCPVLHFSEACVRELRFHDELFARAGALLGTI